jgi:hypothetical protein
VFAFYGVISHVYANLGPLYPKIPEERNKNRDDVKIYHPPKREYIPNTVFLMSFIYKNFHTCIPPIYHSHYSFTAVLAHTASPYMGPPNDASGVPARFEGYVHEIEVIGVPPGNVSYSINVVM